MVCQDELAKAVQIASDFRQKLTEEETLKQDMLNQLLSERASKSKQFLAEQAKLQKALEDANKLQQDLNTLKEDNASLVNANAELSKKFHDHDLDFAKERSEMEKAIESLRNDLSRVQGERKTTESSLHTFYTTQLESIMSEKIESLQANVQLWEKNLLRDKQDALNRLQNQHDAQVQHIKKTIFEDMAKRHRDQLEEVNLALSASKKEADALRDQVNLKQHRSVSTPLLASHFGLEAAGGSGNVGGGGNVESTPTERQDQIWREVLAQSRLINSSSTHKNGGGGNFVNTVQNNLRYTAASSSSLHETASAKQRDIASSAVVEGQSHNPRPFASAFTSSESSPIMTKEEKRQVVQNFVKEYLDENPDAVQDARLMTGLNTMATNLVERTFDEKNISPIQQPKPQQPKRPSTTRRKLTKK